MVVRGLCAFREMKPDETHATSEHPERFRQQMEKSVKLIKYTENKANKLVLQKKPKWCRKGRFCYYMAQP